MGASCLQDADDALVVFSMAILRLRPTLASESRKCNFVNTSERVVIR